MRPNRLQKALKELANAVQKVETLLKEMRSEHDPLAVHIFVSRREYRTMPDTKSDKRQQRAAITSWQEACHLGFRGELREWERLMDAVARSTYMRFITGVPKTQASSKALARRMT